MDNENTNLPTAVVLIAASNCVFVGFTIINANPALNIAGIAVTSSNNLISNNMVLNATRDIYLSGRTENNTISWNHVTNNTYDMSFTYTLHNNVSANTVSYNKDYGL